MVTQETTLSEIMQSDAVIEEMLKAKSAPEPGDFMTDRVIHRGDEEVPTPIVAGNLVSAGHVYIYDTKTGDQSKINRNMLAIQMTKRHPDGSRAFTLTPPNIQPVRGNLLCKLHPDAPDRQEYDRIGFKTCPKSNLMTEFDVEQHMRARHKREWASIEAARTRREKEQDRSLQHKTMAALAAVAKANVPIEATRTKKSKAKNPK